MLKQARTSFYSNNGNSSVLFASKGFQKSPQFQQNIQYNLQQNNQFRKTTEGFNRSSNEKIVLKTQNKLIKEKSHQKQFSWGGDQLSTFFPTSPTLIQEKKKIVQQQLPNLKQFSQSFYNFSKHQAHRTKTTLKPRNLQSYAPFVNSNENLSNEWKTTNPSQWLSMKDYTINTTEANESKILIENKESEVQQNKQTQTEGTKQELKEKTNEMRGFLKSFKIQNSKLMNLAKTILKRQNKEFKVTVEHVQDKANSKQSIQTENNSALLQKPVLIKEVPKSKEQLYAQTERNQNQQKQLSLFLPKKTFKTCYDNENEQNLDAKYLNFDQLMELLENPNEPTLFLQAQQTLNYIKAIKKLLKNSQKAYEVIHELVKHKKKIAAVILDQPQQRIVKEPKLSAIIYGLVKDVPTIDDYASMLSQSKGDTRWQNKQKFKEINILTKDFKQINQLLERWINHRLQYKIYFEKQRFLEMLINYKLSSKDFLNEINYQVVENYEQELNENENIQIHSEKYNNLSTINDFETKHGICPFVTKKNRIISQAYDVDLQNYEQILNPIHELL